ncbi:hypothetical protein BJV82DRAFT_675971 [Fennellomyces sp. T-0311]|nr:hypothetical protein BJV82DRAFT_675971 [Fennellomyces sp. T-0311]
MYHQNTPCLQAINDAPIAVGIFHITGHTPDCQVKYHPRLTIGYGLKDGEWLERLWSYFNGFVSMTRYMTPLNRRLTLTVALKTFSRQKVESIAHTLLRKYKRAPQVQSDADTALVGFNLEELAVEWEKYVRKVVIEPRGAGNSAAVVVTHA